MLLLMMLMNFFPVGPWQGNRHCAGCRTKHLPKISIFSEQNALVVMVEVLEVARQ